MKTNRGRVREARTGLSRAETSVRARCRTRVARRTNGEARRSVVASGQTRDGSRRAETLADREGREGCAGNDLGESLQPHRQAHRGVPSAPKRTSTAPILMKVFSVCELSLSRLASKSFSRRFFSGGEPTTTLFCARRRGGVALRAAPPKHACVASTRPARPARSDTSPRPRGPRGGEPVELGSTSAFVEIDNANASFETRAERFRDSSS